jgi:hypothetical protein
MEYPEQPQLKPEQWQRLRALEHQLDKLHRKFNRVRTPKQQWWDRQSPGGGRGIIYEDEAISLGAIMRDVSKVLDEIEALEGGRASSEATFVYDDAMRRIEAQRREERKQRKGRR